MKKSLMTLALIVAAMTFCTAQQIEMEKVFGGYKFTQNGELLKMRDLVETMQPNLEAYSLIKKAQTNTTMASVLGFAGGALIGWPIGTAIGGGEPNWVLAGIGVGVIAVTIPISSNANKKMKQAVDIYNASLDVGFYQQYKPNLEIVANQHGLGLSLKF